LVVKPPMVSKNPSIGHDGIHDVLPNCPGPHSVLSNRKHLFSLLAYLMCTVTGFGQVDQRDELLAVNSRIDQAVVQKAMPTLDSLYADDFVFTHGTGYVEGKEGWLRSVKNPSQKFIQRQQDSTSVEIHIDIAIVRGKLEILRDDSGKRTAYGIWYQRVYGRRQQQWKLVSHYTTKEWHH